MSKTLPLDYSTVFNASILGMAITDVETGLLLDVNAVWSRATGIAPEAARGRSGAELGLWRSVEARERILGDLRRDGRVQREEVDIVLKGQVVPHYVSGVTFDMGGRRCVLWEFVDLRDTKRAESALRDSEMRYRTLMEQSPLAIQVIGPDGRTRGVNRAWEELWGVSLDALSDYNVLVDTQLNRTGLMQAVLKAFAGQGPFTTVVEYDRPPTGRGPGSGSKRQVRTVVYPSRGSTGDIQEVVLIQEDVTAVQAAQAASRELTQQLETALEAGELGVWSYDGAHDGLIHFDARTAAFFEVPEAVGRMGVTLDMWLQRIHRDDQERIRRRIVEASRTGLASEEQFRLFLPGRRIRHLHVAAVFKPGSTATAQRAGGVVRDITKAVELEHELLAASRRIEEANRDLTRHRDELEELVRQRTAELVRALDEARGASRAKSAFLATVSHELRTPLNAIIGFSGLLDEGMTGPLREDQARQVRLIRLSGQQLLDLVDEILDLSSIEAGSLVMNPMSVKLHTVLQEQLDGARLQAQTANLELRPLECDPAITVRADPRRLAQVTRNLLSNAVKYTARGHVAIRVRLLDGAARVEVVDTGLGVPVDQQSKLFTPFQRVEHPGHMRSGTGLGLAICRRMVSAMNGDIGVISVPGEGSTFWFTVPLG